MDNCILTKEEAWIDPPDLRNVPVDFSQHNFRFTRRWFKYRNQATFSTYLIPHFPSDKPYRFLTIGVFEAYADVWLFQNILKHPDSRWIGIDPWLDTEKLDQEFMDQCYENARHNLQPWKGKCSFYRVKSQSSGGMLQMIEYGCDPFDLIIIDGDHNRKPVYEDACNSLRLTKKGGWLLFDDVRNRIEKKEHVKDGLQDFLNEHGDKVKQVWSHRFCECYEKLG